MTDQKSESDILFPEKEIKLGGKVYAFKPFNFGASGKAIKLLAPLSYALDIRQDEAGTIRMGQISFATLLSTISENDCEAIFTLISLSCGVPVAEIEALPTDEGMTLFLLTYEVAIKPLFQSLKKLIGIKEEEKAEEDGLTKS